ncbi:MAG TPA: class I SAM-dependent methyltransferase [Polyangia bacterium]|jgi:SAM-dependent methyltransferase|nr:class I SAM-dependent methyltransferase [Polyangia bacterium]
MPDNPWLQIPAEDYEAHMDAAGQAEALRNIFSRVYARVRPINVAVLGCTTGSDLGQIDPVITDLVVGVDINPDYLEIARRRLNALGPRLHLIPGDVLEVELPSVRYDLIHAALLLEYVEPRSLLRRVLQWLSAEGTCSLITQEPMPGVAAVSSTGYESLRGLSSRIVLRNGEEVAALAVDAGFRLASRQTVRVPSGKILLSSTFEKTRIAAEPRVAADGAAPRR